MSGYPVNLSHLVTPPVPAVWTPPLSPAAELLRRINAGLDQLTTTNRQPTNEGARACEHI